MKFTPRQPGVNVNVTPTHPLKEFAVLAGGLLAVAVGLYLLLGLAVDLVVPRLSIDFEKKLAAAFTGRLADTEAHTPAANALQTLVDRLQEKCAPLPYAVTVHLQEADAVNAAALPGGQMVVFSGLLKEMRSENELAFVLAHELGHFAHRDHLRGLGRALVLMTASTVLFGADSSVSGMIGESLTLTELSFSRKQETQADEFALQTLNCYYGHAAEATTFFSRIPKSGDPGRFGHYFASHPENRRRIAHLEALIRERNYAIGHPRPLPAALAPEASSP